MEASPLCIGCSAGSGQALQYIKLAHVQLCEHPLRNAAVGLYSEMPNFRRGPPPALEPHFRDTKLLSRELSIYRENVCLKRRYEKIGHTSTIVGQAMVPGWTVAYSRVVKEVVRYKSVWCHSIVHRPRASMPAAAVAVSAAQYVAGQVGRPSA